MSECFIGEIRMFSGNYAPPGWLMCDGQLLTISDNEVLYALLGTTYGGNGSSTFGLPDLRGRVPLHKSATYPLGLKAGTETVTLMTNQLPAHTHVASAQSDAGTASSPANAYWASTGNNIYSTTTTGLVPMNPASVSFAGGSQPHENMMPYLGISFIISTMGIWPSQA